MIRKSFIIIALSIVTSHVVAEEIEWGLGIGGAVNSTVYKDISSEATVLPIFYLQTEKFLILGPRLSYELATIGEVELSVVGQFRFDGFDESDGDVFQGMEDRSPAFDMGVEVEYEMGLGDISFEWLTDVSSTHKGNEMSLSYSIPYRFRRGGLSPYIEIVQNSRELVDYYYGVRENEATTIRPEYIGDSTLNTNVGIQSQWQLGEHHQFIGNVEWSSLGDSIKDSPLVDKSSTFNVIFGYLYAF